MNVGIFGIQGLGWSLRLHETRCGATAAATIETAAPATPAAQPLPAAGLVQAVKILAGHVDLLTDASGLDDEDLLKGLHVTREQVKQLIEADAETANEVMRLGVFTWRPGSSGDGPLTVAMGVGPGDPGSIIVKARPERLNSRLLRHLGCQEQRMEVEHISNELPHWREINVECLVEFGEEFRDVARRRYAKLQQLTQRLTANHVAGRGGG
ncbi:NRT2.5 [Symbiodinium pilosum]|uniref:NRT2.5 protein n=1 Tax=Symbiodinium pilosum TaxID=2952 RepID=A0A812KRC1_SYMPI|nr:NRT2.5 [Symbiodinium pilosum]